VLQNADAKQRDTCSSGSPTGPCAPAVGMSGGMPREVRDHCSISSFGRTLANTPTEAGNFPVKLDQ
jgi:hypothetical protein